MCGRSPRRHLPCFVLSLFRPLLIHRQTLSNELCLDPLVIVKLDPPCPTGNSTYIVDFLPIFVSYSCASDTVEACQKPLRIAVDRIDCRFLIDLTATYSDLEAEEIFDRSQIGGVHIFAETLLPGAGLFRRRKTSLERLHLHFRVSPPGLGCVNADYSNRLVDIDPLQDTAV
jgi:hypothetical protein